MLKRFRLTIVISLAVTVIPLASTVFAKDLKVNTLDGRYQFFSDRAVPTVFDTQTGKAYLWFPRNEENDKNPYVFIQDYVNQVGTSVEIKWESKK